MGLGEEEGGSVKKAHNSLNIAVEITWVFGLVRNNKSTFSHVVLCKSNLIFSLTEISRVLEITVDTSVTAKTTHPMIYRFVSYHTLCDWRKMSHNDNESHIE